MRVLFISNLSTERCGVRAFGEEWVAALRAAGIDVTVWDGTYSAVVQHGYLPPNTFEYEVVHLNWDPQAINHYLPEHFAGLEHRLSVFLHDVPPNSTCPVRGIARWVWAHEPGEGIRVIPHAVPPTPDDLPPVEYETTIGVSGIRIDFGFEQVKNFCVRYGVALNEPSWWSGGPWLSNADEIRRLARSTVNICWYHTTGRGKSMAAMFAIAARRPLILSPSTNFSFLAPYTDEITQGEDWSDESLRICLARALVSDRIPRRAAEELSWDRVIRPIVLAWSDAWQT